MSKKYYSILAVLILVYLIISFGIAPDSATLVRYNISATQLRLLSLTIIIPSILIWVAGFYGMERINRYAAKIKGSTDGEGIKYLGLGVSVLVISVPVVAIVSRLLTAGVQQNVVQQHVATIINTHMNVLFYLVGFALLFAGSSKLLKSLRRIELSQRSISAAIVLLIVIGVPYVFATMNNPSREIAVAPVTVATFAMPDWLIVTTIVVPYLAVWGLGFFTVLYLYKYQQSVGGLLYKKALITLNQGLSTVIASLILLQFLTAAVTAISGWGLSSLLLVIYLLLVVIALGYVMIALGAKRLAKLEEVT